MNILSLFDGISCGQIALRRSGVFYDKYFASEIDSDAIAVTSKHFPDTIYLGDVRSLQADKLNIDFLIGGSPCQGLSLLNRAGQSGLQHPESCLFYEFVRILRETRPRYFLLENVPMRKEWRDLMSNEIGVAPVKVDAACFSEQRRPRLYWTNIPFPIPSESQGRKFPTITTRGAFVGGSALTIDECERLQGLPEGYTYGMSDRLRAIGNGFSIDTVAHILRGLA